MCSVDSWLLTSIRNVLYLLLILCAVVLQQMWNEHFGIGIVEMMAAGLIVVAHNSGGPASDIVHPGETGFLATTADEYATALEQALLTVDNSEMAQKAQVSARRFSDDVFEREFQAAVLPLLETHN